MNAHQQIKSLECETSLINLKELTGKENSEVADKKVKLFVGCVSVFPGPVQLTYIAYANKS